MADGGDGKDYSDEELIEAVLAKAEEAREDFCAFLEFVAKAEHTGEAVEVAPHQRLLSEFVANHRYSVIILPVGAAKTFTIAMYALWLIGRDPTTRGMIVSKTQEQAKKVLKLVRDYITGSAELRLVFPHLVRSEAPGHPWSDTSITVARGLVMRDPTLVAVGIDSDSIAGSRVNFILTDDLLNEENTLTKEQRDGTYNKFQKLVVSRLDPMAPNRPPPRIVVSNSAWHDDDVLHRLKKSGQPTLRMEITGNVYLYNTDWDTPLIRPATAKSPPEECRLVAHDPDPRNVVPLWPERFPNEHIAELRVRYPLPVQFNQLFMGLCRDDETAWCKQEHVDRCYDLARQMGISGFRTTSNGANKVFIGLDLAIKQGDQYDESCFFTFEVLPGGRRVVLEIEYGQWDGFTIVNMAEKKLSAHADSTLCVESVQAQDFIRQWLLARNPALSVTGHETTRAKFDPDYGVPAMFVEMANGAWAFPVDKYGRSPKAMEKFVEEALEFRPSKHTGDGLMAAYMGRQQARKWGFGAGGEIKLDLGQFRR